MWPLHEFIAIKPMNPIIKNEWYETFFTGLNCEMWEKAVTSEWTMQEVSFLIDTLAIQPGAKLLDSPCGYGRHAIELARKGYPVAGIDISAEYIQQLNCRVAIEPLPIQVIYGNILTAEIGDDYDGAYCMGNSFGYFDYEGMNTFVGKVAKALKSGARFVINSGMVAESILPNFPKTGHYVLQGLTMDIYNEYLIGESCMSTKLTYTKSDWTEMHHFKHYVYTLSDIKRLLKEHNLHTVAVYKTTERLDYQLGDQQMYLVAQKS